MTFDSLLERARAGAKRILVAGRNAASVDALVEPLARAGLLPTAVGGSQERPDAHPRLADVAALLRARRPDQVRDGIHALDLASDPLRQSAALVALGAADAMLATPDTGPADLAEAAWWTTEAALADGPVPWLHWLLLDDGSLRAVALCAVAGDLPADLRISLARQAAAAHATTGSGAPIVAFLAGPPEPTEDGVAEAAATAFASRAGAPPAQADRAVRFRDRSNVLIFPGRTAAYLTMRAARELGGALLLGPLLLGPAAVFMGVAPDATDNELVTTAALATLVAPAAGI